MSSQINIYGVTYCATKDEILNNLDILIMQDSLRLLYSNAIKSQCFEIAEMLEYFSCGFSWDGDCRLKQIGTNYLLVKNELLDLIEWYISLSFVFNNEVTTPEKELYVKYFVEAEKIKNEYNPKYGFFTYSLSLFIDLKKLISSSEYSYYIWEYSF